MCLNIKTSSKSFFKSYKAENKELNECENFTMGLGLCCSVNICFNSSQWVFVGRVYTLGSLSWILAWGVKHEWNSKSPEKTFFYTAENKI